MDWWVYLLAALLAAGAISEWWKKHQRTLLSELTSSGKLYHWPPPKARGTDEDSDFDDNQFAVEVVGESYYTRALKTIMGDDIGSEVRRRALLIPETNNPHDRNAVRVDIDGETVGHLSRDDARVFRRRLSRLNLNGQMTTCDAVIGGGKPGFLWRTRPIGVRLNLKPFD